MVRNRLERESALPPLVIDGPRTQGVALVWYNAPLALNDFGDRN